MPWEWPLEATPAEVTGRGYKSRRTFPDISKLVYGPPALRPTDAPAASVPLPRRAVPLNFADQGKPGAHPMRHIRFALAVAGAAIFATPIFADDWPSRPVRMVNTFAAGGTADVLTRLVADHLSSVFK